MSLNKFHCFLKHSHHCHWSNNTNHLQMQTFISLKCMQPLTPFLCVFIMPQNTPTTVPSSISPQHESLLIPCHNEVGFQMATCICLPNTNNPETLYLVRFTKPGLSTHIHCWREGHWGHQALRQTNCISHVHMSYDRDSKEPYWIGSISADCSKH